MAKAMRASSPSTSDSRTSLLLAQVYETEKEILVGSIAKQVRTDRYSHGESISWDECEDLAKELLQEATVTVLSNQYHFDAKPQLSLWLKKTACNYLRHQREKRNRQLHQGYQEISFNALPYSTQEKSDKEAFFDNLFYRIDALIEDGMEAHIEHREYLEFLFSLVTGCHRYTLQLFLQCKLDIVVFAQEIGCDLPNARVKLYRAYQAARKALQPYLTH